MSTINKIWSIGMYCLSISILACYGVLQIPAAILLAIGIASTIMVVSEKGLLGKLFGAVLFGAITCFCMLGTIQIDDAVIRAGLSIAMIPSAVITYINSERIC